MRRQHAQLFVCLGVFGLILFTMAACGGSTSPTTGSGSPTSASTPTSFASTAKLTVSGGLIGTYTISDQSSGASEYNQSSSSTQLKIAVAHVKGTISCPKMNSDAPTKEQPITISNGSFDVLIQKTNVP